MMVWAVGIMAPPVKPWPTRPTIITASVVDRAAQDENSGEQAGRQQQEGAQAEYPLEPAGQRDDDDLGDQVAGGDPGAFGAAGADLALDDGAARS
jgi:hypothetical protein